MRAEREALCDHGPQTFTRDELLAAMTISPCHISGTHDPQHTPKYICQSQMKEALAGVLSLLGLTPADLPRTTHAYPKSGADGVLEAAWVEKRPIAFTASNVPDKTFSDFSTCWNEACDARRPHSNDKFVVSAMTEGLDEPQRVAWW